MSQSPPPSLDSEEYSTLCKQLQRQDREWLVARLHNVEKHMVKRGWYTHSAIVFEAMRRIAEGKV